VLQADAGTRTTAITGGFVLADGWQSYCNKGVLERSPIRNQIAAVSVGLLWAVLDLNYVEDVAAEVDLNVVMNDQLGIIEVQGTAESGSFSRVQLNQILDVAEKAFKSC